jgi:hypothetical protein
MHKQLRRVLAAALTVALWVGLVVVAAKVTHDFYRYIDRSIFVSVDDSEANIAYALANQGRYGFLASPVLAGMDRTHGQFNYGPWYFYLAGALIWVFGYSLTLVRSIHLWGILASIGVGAFWFRGRDRTAATVLYGLGILYCFDVSHWPMARPDILVSVFALLLLVCVGVGMLRSQPLYWFGAGVAAVCGAFTHLIAASLLPSAVLLFLLASWQEILDGVDRRASWRHVRNSAIALAAGIGFGLAMFYASFGFRFATQWRFLTAYRALTVNSDSFTTALGHHLTYAFGYLSRGMQLVVWATLASGWVLPALALRLEPPHRREVFAYVLPPVVVWSAYLLSNGLYTNYHQGYAILHQVLFLWTATAIVWTVLRFVRLRYPRAGAVLGSVVVVLLIVQTGRQLTWQFGGDSWKIQKIATWVPFSEYSVHVLEAIPTRSTAWGTVMFGIEAPDRIQLVQWSDAATLFSRIAPAERPALTPDYIVWAYPEARDNMLSATRSRETLLSRTAQLMSDSQLRLVSLVAGAPYGVTRTYARHIGELDPVRSVPSVSVYDADHQRWLTRLGPAVPVEFKATAPAVLHIGYEANPPASVPTNTMVADLPADRYLLQVSLKPGQGNTNRRLLAATSPNMMRQTMGEAGPDGDFASYLATDTQVFMVAIHSGGPLYVSQFDDGVDPGIKAVTAYPIVGLLDPREQPSYESNLPDLKAWVPTTGVEAHLEGNTVRVSGNDTAGGYQLMSPLIRAHEHDEITVRMSVHEEQGNVCAGALTGNSLLWLVPPDIPRGELHFTMDATQAFRVVLANCNSRPGMAKSRFVLWPGTYLDDAVGEYYVDRLVSAALRPDAVKAPEPAGPGVQTFPAGLALTKAEVEGPIEALLPADIAFHADIVQQSANTWTAKGKAQGPFTYLWQWKERRLDKNSRVLVAGRVEEGGISIGLLRNNQWVAQVNITDPGDFTVVIAPPSGGSYSILAANDLQHGLDTSIVLTKIGLIRSK